MQSFKLSLIHGLGIYVLLMSSCFSGTGRYKRWPILYVVAIRSVGVPLFSLTTLPVGLTISVCYNCCCAATYVTGIWNTGPPLFTVPSSCHGVRVTSENATFSAVRQVWFRNGTPRSISYIFWKRLRIRSDELHLIAVQSSGTCAK